MDRASIYFIDENMKNQNTFSFDEDLPSLPLPDLHATMQRYYESLKPFGTADELANSRKIIADFENGIGGQLHELLKKRASKTKNWLDEWWDKYAYHMLRMPLQPYTVMATSVYLSKFNIPESSAHMLKNLARMLYYTIEFWDLLRRAKLKPLSSNAGKIKYSSNLYKRFFSTTRVPGLEYDHIDNHFKIVTEGDTPTHGLISGKGRLFVFDTTHADGSIATSQELLIMLQRVRSILDYEPVGDCVPVLTHDERTSWAQNRQKLIEVSADNEYTLKLVESANVVIVLDEHEPRDYEEVSQLAINGDFHSKWGDRSSTIIAFKNGKFACVGEHSAYDGTISVSYVFYVLLSLYEEPEPDWHANASTVLTLRELKFHLNNDVKVEIERLLQDCDRRRTDVIVTYTKFTDFSKDYIKSLKMHPDSFVQVLIQLAYARLHKTVVPIYETALMRHYYKGRTETLRSCTNMVHQFLQIAMNQQATHSEIANAFRSAVEHHTHMMNEARKGHGVDRHLFGLWCTAFENNIEIPAFFDDPLYAKSGGGGNYVLSTSTLGYSPIVGFVAPMVLDGYGVFYSITSDEILLQSAVYRDSTVTSAHNFNETLKHSFLWIKSLLDETQTSKL